ncbi:hypothetical protein [Algicola sagamiensis]|uniref:hypothetical protein n=1 Tax=Algicola sagamiensis TaxID=163869 RepID=UPI00037E5BE8|nr:hypothetical protein [Algicola sagamiensis]
MMNIQWQAAFLIGLTQLFANGRVIAETNQSVERMYSTDSADSTDPTDPTDPVDPVEMVNILVLKQSELDSVVSPSDCTEIQAQILDQDPTLYYQEGEVSGLKMTYAQQWYDKQEQLIQHELGEILVRLASVESYASALIELPKAEWEDDAIDKSNLIDMSTIEFQNECIVPSRVTYHATDLKLDTHEKLFDWMSAATRQNLEKMAVTPKRFQRFYGYDGLGFGSYVKAGIHFELPKAMGDFAKDGSWFSLRWRVKEPDVSELAQAVIPAEIESAFIPQWNDTCRPVQLRFSMDEDFYQSTLPIKTLPSRCEEKPLFIQDDFAALNIDELTDQQHRQYLLDGYPLNRITRQLDYFGNWTLCRNGLSRHPDSCPGIIRNDFWPVLKPFFTGESSLWVEVTFDDYFRKVYFLDTATGQIEEVASTRLAHQE